jgi:micrococcal nuclease
VVLLIVLLAILRAWQEAQQAPAPAALSEGMHTVERVVDGDTLLLTNKARVRLQGVDTPETVQPNHPVEPWGPESSEFTREFIGDGRVRLRFDLERKDRYGRFLAYVYKGERMLNEELLRAGLARARLEYRYSDTMKRRFREAEQEARDAGRGIWSGLPEPQANRARLPLPLGEGVAELVTVQPTLGRSEFLRIQLHAQTGMSVPPTVAVAEFVRIQPTVAVAGFVRIQPAPLHTFPSRAIPLLTESRPRTVHFAPPLNTPFQPLRTCRSDASSATCDPARPLLKSPLSPHQKKWTDDVEQRIIHNAHRGDRR